MTRMLLVLLLLATLGGCVTMQDDDKSLERMIRNHNAAIQTTA